MLSCSCSERPIFCTHTLLTRRDVVLVPIPPQGNRLEALALLDGKDNASERTAAWTEASLANSERGLQQPVDLTEYPALIPLVNASVGPNTQPIVDRVHPILVVVDTFQELVDARMRAEGDGKLILKIVAVEPVVSPFSHAPLPQSLIIFSAMSSSVSLIMIFLKPVIQTLPQESLPVLEAAGLPAGVLGARTCALLP